jgi:putative colanic acid biosynthesis glycosyltransferase
MFQQALIKSMNDLTYPDVRTEISDSDKPLVSVITVTYNAEKTLESTILSVINQTYSNIEFIIIDGLSTDGTMEYISKNQDNISYWISEPDRGIYDAMNKGIEKSKGDWLIFLGADDVFFDKSVIENLVKASKSRDREGRMMLAVFGNTLYSDGKYFRSFIGVRTLIRNTVQHQAVIYHRSLFDGFRYDPSLRICSDYELNLLLYTKKIQLQYIDHTISICSCGGLSTTFGNQGQAIDEYRIIRERHIHPILNKAISISLIIRLTIKLLIHDFLRKKNE